MQKIPCLFVRDFSTRLHITTQVVTEGCEWVLAGEGAPTRKWDGTAVLIRDGRVFARYDLKSGRTQAPEGFQPCQPEPDPVTGYWPGWLEVKDQPQYKWHALAFADIPDLPPGTYELCGPKVNSNAERFCQHVLIRHGHGYIPALPDRSFETLRDYFIQNVMEGLVFHHPDGRMCKIRRADFGILWPPPV